MATDVKANRPIQRNTYGDVRETDSGKTIFTEKGWTPYPKGAADLIAFARERGWTVISDGLPVRTNADGDLIVAVLLTRSAGPTLDGKTSLGYTLRVPWVCQHTTFRVGSIVVKAHRRGWRDIPSLTAAQGFIHEHLVPKDGATVRITG